MVWMGIHLSLSLTPVFIHNSSQARDVTTCTARTATSVSGDCITSRECRREQSSACSIILVSASLWSDDKMGRVLDVLLSIMTVSCGSWKQPARTSWCPGPSNLLSISVHHFARTFCKFTLVNGFALNEFHFFGTFLLPLAMATSKDVDEPALLIRSLSFIEFCLSYLSNTTSTPSQFLRRD